MQPIALSEASRRDRFRQQGLIAIGTCATAAAGLYAARLVAGVEAAGMPVRPPDRVLIPVVTAGLVCAGWLLLRAVAYRSACRMAALAAYAYALTVAVRPFAAESPISHALAQSGVLTPWLVLLAVLAIPQNRVPRRLRAVAAAAALAFPLLAAAVRIAAFPQADAGDPRWLAVHAAAGAAADAGTGAAVASVLAVLLQAYLHARTPRTREPVLWTIGGVLVSLPAYLLLRLPAAPSGAIADLLLLPLPAFFLTGTRRIRDVDQRRAINRFCVTAIVLAVLLLLVLPVGDFLQRQIAASYDLTERAAAFLVLGPLFVALFGLHAVLARAMDRAGGGHPGAAPARGGRSRGVRDLRMLTRALHRSLGGAMSAAAGALDALESALESERDGSRPQAAAAPRLPAGALDSVRGLRQTALTVLAALRRLEAGTRAGGATAAVAVADLCSAAWRRAGRRSDLRVELVEGADLTVACDPAEVARALAELLVNAEEAGVRQRSRITMRAREQGSDVVIEVQDSGARPLGPGRARMFEPFYSTKPGHHGLGLYISRALIEHNDGSLVLQRGGEGTHAVVTLPAAGS